MDDIAAPPPRHFTLFNEFLSHQFFREFLAPVHIIYVLELAEN